MYFISGSESPWAGGPTGNFLVMPAAGCAGPCRPCRPSAIGAPCPRAAPFTALRCSSACILRAPVGTAALCPPKPLSPASPPAPPPLTLLIRLPSSDSPPPQGSSDKLLEFFPFLGCLPTPLSPLLRAPPLPAPCEVCRTLCWWHLKPHSIPSSLPVLAASSPAIFTLSSLLMPAYIVHTCMPTW